LKELDIGVIIILKWILGKQDGDGMDWIDLARERGQWRAFENMLMNFWVPQNVGNFSSN
jgi:hypothetical protein